MRRGIRQRHLRLQPGDDNQQRHWGQLRRIGFHHYQSGRIISVSDRPRSDHIGRADADASAQILPAGGPFGRSTSSIRRLGKELLAVDVTVNGTMIASVDAENLASDAITYQTTQEAVISARPARQPGSTRSATVPPDKHKPGAFDGSLDYGGPSGRSDTNLATQRLYNGIFADSPFETAETDPVLLAAFTGTGVYDLPISSLGTSSAEGGANLQVDLDNIGAAIQLAYVHTPAADPACFVTAWAHHDGSRTCARRASFQGHARRARHLASKVCRLGESAIETSTAASPAGGVGVSDPYP